MRTLVTGASGHVGGAVVERLATAGHEVVALGRRPPLVPGASQVLITDLARPDALEELAAEGRCDAVVHAAAAISADPHEPAIGLVNCLATQQLLRQAEEWSCRRFVFLSSVQVVGRPRLLSVDEDHPLDPPTAYHASKLFGERLVELAGRRGLGTASLRISSPAGPGTPDGRILSVFVRRALAGEPLEVMGEGTRRQDYVDVRDVADAVASALDSETTGVFNVASGTPVSNLELARRCIAALGSTSQVCLGGRPDPEDGVVWQISVERAGRALGYAPTRSLEDSLRAMAGFS